MDKATSSGVQALTEKGRILTSCFSIGNDGVPQLIVKAKGNQYFAGSGYELVEAFVYQILGFGGETYAFYSYI